MYITNWHFTYNGVVSFSRSQSKVFWSYALLLFDLKFPRKTLFLVIRLVSQKSKANLLVKTMILCEILKQKRFPRKRCSKGSARLRKNVSDGFRLQKSSKTRSLILLKIDFASQYLWHFWKSSEQPTRGLLQPTSSIMMWYHSLSYYSLEYLICIYFNVDTSSYFLIVCLIIFHQYHPLLPIFVVKQSKSFWIRVVWFVLVFWVSVAEISYLLASSI